MHASLRLQIAVGVFPDDPKHRVFDSRLLSRENIEDLQFETPPLRPPLVHSHQNIGPITGFRPSRTSIQTEDRIPAVIGLGEDELYLRLIQHLQRLGHFLGILRLGRRTSILFRQLLMHREVADFSLQLPHLIELFSDAVGLSRNFLCLRGIIPEVGGRHPPLEILQLGFQFGRVKETSVIPASGNPRR